LQTKTIFDLSDIGLQTKIKVEQLHSIIINSTHQSVIYLDFSKLYIYIYFETHAESMLMHNIHSVNIGDHELPVPPLARLNALFGDARFRIIAIDVETRLDRGAALAAGLTLDGKALMPPHLFEVTGVNVFVSHYKAKGERLPSGFDIRSYTGDMFTERDLIAILVAEITHANDWFSFAWERHERAVLLSRGAVHGLDLSTIFVSRGSADQPSAIKLDITPLSELCTGMGIPIDPSEGGPLGNGRSARGEARATALWLLSTFAHGPDVILAEMCWELLARWIENQPSLDHLCPFIAPSIVPPGIRDSEIPQA
jgi:hypothetical protein